MDALIVVDMQNDFIKKDGALSVPNAETIVENINKLIETFISTSDVIFFTRDMH